MKKNLELSKVSVDNIKQLQDFIVRFSIKMSLAFVNVSWSAFNSLIFTETSTMSLSFAIFSPFSLSASDLALKRMP
jgi:flagellar assembly factor FliW